MGALRAKIFLLFLFPLLVWGSSENSHTGCPDVITLRDNDIETVKPKIIYFEGNRNEAEVFCGGQELGIVELVSDKGSLGVVEDKAHKLICRLGRWYGASKHHEVIPVKEVACLIHTMNVFY